MEPVNGAAELSDELSQTVAPLHVRELMQQNHPPAILMPFGCIGRQKNDRIQDAPRCRHCRVIASQQPHPARDPKIRCNLLDNTLPLGLVES